MGAAMLVSGIVTIQVTRILWGGVIVIGALALHLLRRYECRKQERLRSFNERKEAESKEHNHAGKG
jgi:type VI protein secretion system component VasK